MTEKFTLIRLYLDGELVTDIPSNRECAIELVESALMHLERGLDDSAIWRLQDAAKLLLGLLQGSSYNEFG